MAAKKKATLTGSRKAALTRKHQAIRVEGAKLGQSKGTIASRLAYATFRANQSAGL